MTAKLGKLFVFFNIAIALALVVWAVSLTSNRLDWIDRPEGFNEADDNPYADDTNNLDRLAKKVAKLNDGIKSAQNGLAAKSTFVLASETDRDARFSAIALRINDAKSGKFKTLTYIKNSGLLVLRPNNAVDVRGIDDKPLAGLDAIQREIRDSVSNQSALVKESYRLRKLYETFTDEMIALDEEIERQKIIKTNGEAEAKYLADRSTDWDEQVRTLQRRTKQLVDRIAELKAPPKKSAIDGKVTSNVRP